ncbi:MAG: DUF3788 family protein [Terracidiphilus sp.]|jgi:hypothetical protein
MEYSNAFLGRPEQPSEAEVTAALGSTAKLWTGFIEWMAKEEGVAGQEWKGICVNKYGWSLRLKRKSRNIAHLGPGDACFMVSFALSDKALKVAKEAHLPKAVVDALDAAPRYPEGNALRLVVHNAGDVAAIRKIAAIKLAN